LDKRLKDSHVDSLFEAILTLKTKKELYQFFEDVSTVKELKALAQRFEVAKKLSQGEKYETIVQETGASSATISRVKRYLNYGADGYRLALSRVKVKGQGSK